MKSEHVMEKEFVLIDKNMRSLNTKSVSESPKLNLFFYSSHRLYSLYKIYFRPLLLSSFSCYSSFNIISFAIICSGSISFLFCTCAWMSDSSLFFLFTYQTAVILSMCWWVQLQVFSFVMIIHSYVIALCMNLPA